MCFLSFSNVFANGILLFCLLHLFLCTLQQSVLPALCSLLVSGFLPCPALPAKLRRGRGFVFAAPVRCFDKILPIWLRLLALGSRMCYNSDVYSIVLECIKVRWNGHAALEGLLRKAVQDYEMIAPGDRVCVGVSGGKDSVALTVALGHLRRYLGVPFEVMAVTLDPRFGGVEADYQPLADLFAQEGIPYEIRRTDIGPVVFDYRKEPNPCALCAKMRRGALHAAAQELGCNKVALGHHLDDAVETFYMNLWREGRIGCFSPQTYLDQRNITLIRPMIFATESEVKSAVYHAGPPIIKSRCPADGATVREQTKLFVQQMSRDDPAFRQKTLHALQQSGIDGWLRCIPGTRGARFPRCVLYRNGVDCNDERTVRKALLGIG